MDQTLLIVLVAVFIVAVVGFGIYRKQAQRKRLEAFASSRGWTFAKRDDSLLQRYPDLFPMGVGTDRKVLNVIQFEAGSLPAQSFDYQYTEVDNSSGSSNDSSSTTSVFHVVGVQIPQPLPRLEIRPRRKLDALEARITKPIQFESADFNGKWVVQGEHPPAAHDMIHPGMMEWLLTVDSKPTMSLEDHHLFIHAKGRQKPENIDAMVAVLTGFVERLPRHVWQKAEGEYPRPKRYRSTMDLGSFLKSAKQGREGQPSA